MTDCKFAKLSGALSVLLLAGSFSFSHAAQLDKGKATKAPPAAVKEDPGPWLLAGREGECVPTSILGKKGPEYNSIEVRAPSAGFVVMFVKKEFCDKAAPGPEKKK
jgi:hypothetical protein